MKFITIRVRPAVQLFIDSPLFSSRHEHTSLPVTRFLKKISLIKQNLIIEDAYTNTSSKVSYTYIKF